MTGNRDIRRPSLRAARRAGDFDTLLVQAVERGAARRAASAAAGAAAFRVTVEQRLKALENELTEVKNRLNGLLFLAAGTVLAQVALHIFHR